MTKTKRKVDFQGNQIPFSPPDEHYLSSHIFTAPIKVIEFPIKSVIMAASIYHTSPIAHILSAFPNPFLAGARREQRG